MNRRSFLNRSAWVSTGLLFVPRIIRAQVALPSSAQSLGGGLTGTVVPAASGGGGTQNASDNFNRANETPFSNSNWTSVPNESGTANLVSNAVTFNVSTNNAAYYWNALSWNADQTSSCKVFGGPSVTSATGWGVIVRASASVRTYFEAIVWSGNVRLAQRIAGSGTTLSGWPKAITYVSGAILILSVSGTGLSAVLTVTYNGTVIGTANPTSAIDSGSPGFRYSSQDSTAAMTIDDWAGSSP